MDHYIKPLLEYRKLILAIMAAAVLAGIALSFVMPSSYKATTSVLLKPISADPLDGIEADSGGAVDISTELLIATSKAVTNLASEDLAAQSISISSSELADRVIATSPKNTKILEVTFEAGTPEVAKIGADTVARNYLSYRAGIAAQNRSTAVEALDDRISLLKENLAQVESDLNRAVPETQPYVALSVERDSLLAELVAQQDALAALSTLSLDAGEVLDPAALPTSPAGLNLVTIIVGALAGGLIVGVVAALLLSAVKASNAPRNRRATDRVEHNRRREDRSLAVGRRASDSEPDPDVESAVEKLARVTSGRDQTSPDTLDPKPLTTDAQVQSKADLVDARPSAVEPIPNKADAAPAVSTTPTATQPTQAPTPPKALQPSQAPTPPKALQPTQAPTPPKAKRPEPPPPPPKPKTVAPTPPSAKPASTQQHAQRPEPATPAVNNNPTASPPPPPAPPGKQPPASAVTAPSNLLAEADFGRIRSKMSALKQPIALLAVGELSREGAIAAAFSLADALDLETSEILIVDALFEQPMLSDTLRLNEAPGLTDALLGNTELNAVVQAVPELDRVHAVSAGRPNAIAKSALSTEMMGRLLRTAKRHFTVTIVVAGNLNDAALINRAGDVLDGVVVSTQQPIGHQATGKLARMLRDLPAPVWARMSAGGLETAAQGQTAVAM